MTTNSIHKTLLWVAVGATALVLLCIAVVVMVLGDRRNPPVIEPAGKEKDPLKEHMVNANKYIAQSEATSISAYIERRKWPMVQMPNGGWLWEYERGAGEAIQPDERVALCYNLEAINGVRIYTDKRDTVMVGRQQTMVGLDAALTSLHHGSKARLVLPSSLAYGIAGDNDRVPKSAIVILDVTIDNKLKNNN
ncbi:MAG: FKBP-type peptidyl-prolyl cis-trans isomerase [Bacteroidales bacterium]|nr:FKBP-type peptidyl-prolyl cis-trans isomerase [Bacteroidales bacterium]